MVATQPEYPRSYQAQRMLEFKAKKTREAQVQMGVTVPPICGYEYKPRKNRRPDVNSSIEDVATCHRQAGAGTTHVRRGYCDYHEVDAERKLLKKPRGDKSQINAARNLAYQSAKFFGEPINVDPHTALLQEVHRTAGIVAWLEQKLSRMKEDGTPEDDVLTQFSKQHGIVPSVWMTLYQQERDRVVQVSVAAIKAGVAERRVQLAEQQGRLIAEIMLAFIRDPQLGLTPQQMITAPDVIRKHLSLLPTTENTSPSMMNNAIEATVVD